MLLLYLIIFQTVVIRIISGDADLDLSFPPLVYTRSGWVQGYFQKTLSGRAIAAFEGIPFAKSPEGSLRFQSPRPFPPWHGIRPAVTKAPICLQLDPTKLLLLRGEEDCLLLQVYTPQLPFPPTKEALLPVIVFIHGGGYNFDRSSNYGAAYLNGKAVFVTINYRVGVLGFFTTGDKEASGNWGLKDQLLGLQWARENIAFFGGDPDRVTLMGTSAGAASVGLHIVSERSKGLFQRAIIQSGSPFAYWGLVNDSFENSKLVAKWMGCSTPDTRKVAACLRQKNANWIVGKSINTWKVFLVQRFPFGPVVEDPSSPSAFLIETPEASYKAEKVLKVPLIVGMNKDEGGLASAIYLVPGQLQRYNTNWEAMSAYTFAFDNGRTNDSAKVAQKVKEFYLKGAEKLTFWNRQDWTKMTGDRMFAQGVYILMTFHSKVAPTFGYLFSHFTERNFISLVGLNPKEWGVSHQDEMIFLANSSSNYPNLDPRHEKDLKVAGIMVDLWTSFAASGIPSISSDAFKWTPIASGERNVKILKITETPKMIEFPQDLRKRIKFWQDLKLKGDSNYDMA